MKEITVIDSAFAYGGFTSGNKGIWTRNEPFDPPAADYVSLGEKLRVPLSKVIRPYQAGGDRVEAVGAGHGGSGVIKDNELRQVDGLVTAEKGIVLSVIAADCVPVYLVAEKAEVIGILHCGWKSAAGELLYNAVDGLDSGRSHDNDLFLEKIGDTFVRIVDIISRTMIALLYAFAAGDTF